MVKLESILKIMHRTDLLDEDLIYSDEFAINEGLTRTWPLDKTISLLKSSKFNAVTVSGKNKYELILPVKNSDRLSKAIVISNNMGWFPSYIRVFLGDMEIDPQKYDDDNLTSILSKDIDRLVITFEAKYDLVVHDIPKYLYHIAPREVAAKILKFGLTPKSNSAVSSHPERVYLGKSPEDVKKLTRRIEFARRSRDGKFWILKVTTGQIPSYFKVFDQIEKSNNMHSDPNFLDRGVYTLNSIPPSAIEFEDEIDVNVR